MARDQWIKKKVKTRDQLSQEINEDKRTVRPRDQWRQEISEDRSSVKTRDQWRQEVSEDKKPHAKKGVFFLLKVWYSTGIF